jgi:hypothetical protein
MSGDRCRYSHAAPAAPAGDDAAVLPPPALLQGRSELPGGWVKCLSPDGRPFYHCVPTGTSHWELPHDAPPPASFPLPSEPPPPRPEELLSLEYQDLSMNKRMRIRFDQRSQIDAPLHLIRAAVLRLHLPHAAIDARRQQLLRLPLDYRRVSLWAVQLQRFVNECAVLVTTSRRLATSPASIYVNAARMQEWAACIQLRVMRGYVGIFQVHFRLCKHSRVIRVVYLFADELGSKLWPILGFVAPPSRFSWLRGGVCSPFTSCSPLAFFADCRCSAHRREARHSQSGGQW